MGVEGAAGALEGEGWDLEISADIRAAKSIVMVVGGVALLVVCADGTEGGGGGGVPALLCLSLVAVGLAAGGEQFSSLVL